MSRKILLSRDAAKFLEKISKKDKDRIKDALLDIAEDPYSLPYKKIRGRKGLLRVRVGDYRILYQVIEKEIWVILIEHREEIYKKLKNK